MSTVTIIALYGLGAIWGPMIGFAPLLLFRPDPGRHGGTDQRIRTAHWLWTRGLRPALALSVVLGAVILLDQIAR